MGLFGCRGPKWTEWKAQDRWRAVHTTSGAVRLERQHIRVDTNSEFLTREVAWNVVATFNSVDGCRNRRNRIRLEEGLVFEYLEEDAELSLDPTAMAQTWETVHGRMVDLGWCNPSDANDAVIQETITMTPAMIFQLDIDNPLDRAVYDWMKWQFTTYRPRIKGLTP